MALDQLNKLNNLFYDPKIGFTNVSELYRKAKEQNIKLTMDQIKKWYESQAINQIYKQPTKVVNYSKIRSHWRQPGEMQGDLMILNKYSRHNSGYKYIFNVIDIFSRYCWSFPLKTKSPDEIAPHLETIFNAIPKQNYRSIRFDKGSEFRGAVDTVLDHLSVKKFLNDPEQGKNSQAIVERFNSTLWNKLKKYMNYAQTLRYIDVLDDLIYNYNHTKHRTTRKRPIDVLTGRAYPYEEGLDSNTPTTSEFHVGDTVRHVKSRNTFDKRGFVPTFTSQVYKIVKKRGNKYELINGRTFYAEELVKTTENSQESTFDEQYDNNQQTERFERKQREEFGVPNSQVEQQIMNTKRERKQVKREGFVSY